MVAEPWSPQVMIVERRVRIAALRRSREWSKVRMGPDVRIVEWGSESRAAGVLAQGYTGWSLTIWERLLMNAAHECQPSRAPTGRGVVIYNFESALPRRSSRSTLPDPENTR